MSLVKSTLENPHRMSITAKLLFGFMFEYNGHFDFRENAVGVRLLLSHLLFNQNGKHTLRRFATARSSSYLTLCHGDNCFFSFLFIKMGWSSVTDTLLNFPLIIFTTPPSSSGLVMIPSCDERGCKNEWYAQWGDTEVSSFIPDPHPNMLPSLGTLFAA